MRYSGVGGQAVMEGVMMKNQNKYAVAVRKPDHKIEVKISQHKMSKPWEVMQKIPVLRGVVIFVDSLYLGMSTLMYSASFFEDEDEENEKKQKRESLSAEQIKALDKKEKKQDDLLMGGTVALSIVIALGLFFALPYFLSGIFHKITQSQMMIALFEGIIRLVIFIGYIAIISMTPDIKRTFMYHGAEHKCINCIEHGMELNVENVRKSSKLHKRCGTSFLLIVMLISILFFMFIRVDSKPLQLLLRLVLIPVIAGVSFEFIRLAGRYDNWFMNILSQPGLWMQRLTTKEPDDDMIEVGIASVEAVFDWKAWQKDSPLQKENSNLKTVMDFAFFDRVNQAKNEETDAWWNGFNRIYNSLCYDYLYKDPSHVMAFIENHDTDRFLGETQDTLALKQALALLLTVNRIPQLYYGTEVLMNGTKQVTDGNVRKDFPGGFPGDTRSAFTTEGRTKAENDMFRWTARLLHWRQGNEVITKGKQTQFIPQNGVYVVARSYNGKNVMTVINGTSKAATMKAERYAEIIGDAQEATNILTGHKINISKDVKLAPRGVMVLEF